MARWVTVRLDAFPFDYKMPKSNAWLKFSLDAKDPDDKGERYVPDDQADFIVARGYGAEGRLNGSTTKSRKGKTQPAKPAKTPRDGPTPDTRSDARLAAGSVASDDSSEVRGGVAQPAG